MAFKKHNWLTYGRRGNMIEITIRDEVGTKIDFFRTADDRNFRKIAKIIKEKYGFSFSQESNNDNESTEKLIKEKNWLDKDIKW